MAEQAQTQSSIDPLDNIPRTFLPFALPDIGDEELRPVEMCLRSGWVNTGPTTGRFEQ